jgi:hypothetical protein
MANPTTNYGFVLPTATDLVTDLPADFEVALQGVDTRLKALQPGTTTGDLAYSSATANTNTRLGIGSTGQVLTVAGGVPTWAAPAGGGKVLQVVSATTTTETTNSTTTYADTTLTATITPTSATSTILVMVHQNGVSKSVTSTTNAIILRLVRGATEIALISNVGLFTSTALQLTGTSASIAYTDSPATTSATTYKTQFKNNAASANVKVQVNDANSTITLLEIGA